MSNKRKKNNPAQPAQDESRNRALVYVRLSGNGEKQVAPDVQIANAQFVINHLGAAFEPNTDLYNEGAGLHSAFKRNNLEACDAMLERALSDPTVRNLIADDSARFVRNIEAGNSILKIIEASGIELHTFVNGRLSLQSEEFRLKTQIGFMIDEEESRRTSRRLKAHYFKLENDGVYFSHLDPIGLHRSGSVSNGSLRWMPSEDFWIIQKIFDLYVAGHGAPSIAGALKGAHWTWRNRNNRVMPVTVGTVTGIIWRLERYAPFLDAALYEHALRERASRENRAGNHAKLTHPPLLLRRIAFCAHCHKPLKQHNQIKRYRDNRVVVYPNYAHPYAIAPVCVFGNAPAAPLHADLWRHLQWLDSADNKEKIKRAAEELRNQVVTDESAAARNRLLALRERYEEMCAAGAITIARLKEHQRAIDTQMRNLPKPPPPKQVLTPAEMELVLAMPLAVLRAQAERRPDLVNQFLQYICTRVFVAPGRITKIEYSPTIALAQAGGW